MEVSGWYYDLQLGNRLISATLHPNQQLNDDKSKWVDIRGEKDPDNDKYAKDPICTAIINEDFNVAVANSWSDFGGDMLGQMWESIKPLAPYADAAKTMIGNAVKQYNDMLNSTNPEDQSRSKRIRESAMSQKMGELMTIVNDKLNDPNSGIDITDYLNRALVVQGTRFSYYSGSGTSFGNLMMKFTLFPTYNEKGEFESVDKQVEKLFPYCIGKFVSGTDGLLTNEEKENYSAIDNMISWQKPPGGFKANVKNVDVVQTGTLLLKFGAYYMIDNLVVENASFNFSKQMTKNPAAYKSVGSSDILSPLYCDISIQLRPATKYSDESLKKFVLGRGATETLEKLNNKLKENVNGIFSI